MQKSVVVNVKCPHCGESLMDQTNALHDVSGIHLNIKSGEKSGNIYLCSHYGCYDHKSDLELAAGEIAEFSCPHCNTKLAKDSCEKCSAPMVPLLLENGGKVNFCSRKGCPQHQIVFEDVNDAMQLFYDEYGT